MHAKDSWADSDITTIYLSWWPATISLSDLPGTFALAPLCLAQTCVWQWALTLLLGSPSTGLLPKQQTLYWCLSHLSACSMTLISNSLYKKFLGDLMVKQLLSWVITYR
jgi:hypothetical protein